MTKNDITQVNFVGLAKALADMPILFALMKQEKELSMKEIAVDMGISAPALYRFYRGETGLHYRDLITLVKWLAKVQNEDPLSIRRRIQDTNLEDTKGFIRSSRHRRNTESSI